MGGDAVKVIVRCRPLLPHETGSEGAASVRLDASQSQVRVVEQAGEKSFAFDAIVGPTSSQADVYNTGAVGDLVQSALAGFQATIFAYGQTASGKTYTMEGFEYTPTSSQGPVAKIRNTTEEQLGIVPRALRDLFAPADDPRTQRRMRMSYFQIYREQILDLLSLAPLEHVAGKHGPRQASSLRLRWSKSREFFVEGLSEHTVASADDALALFQAGVHRKIMAETHMNAASSRSHCVLQVLVDTVDAESGDVLHTGALNLVDLAGSERQPKGTEKSKHMAEAVDINRSLFTLRKVIFALSDRRVTALQHIPYRDSILTRVLKQSLGGTARTLMVACISSADQCLADTQSTLAYAARARSITNRPVVNTDPRTLLVRELRAEVAQLRAEVARLQAVLGQGVEAPATNVGAGRTSPAPADPTAPVAARRPRRDAEAPSAVPIVTSGARGLQGRLEESVAALGESTATAERLRSALDALTENYRSLARLQADVVSENSDLRERVRMFEEVLAMETYPGDPGAGREEHMATTMRACVKRNLALEAEVAALRDELDTQKVLGTTQAQDGPRQQQQPRAPTRPPHPPRHKTGDRGHTPTAPSTTVLARPITAAVGGGAESLADELKRYAQSSTRRQGVHDAWVPPKAAEDIHENLDQLAALLQRRAKLASGRGAR